MGLGVEFLGDLIELKKSGLLDGVKRIVEIGDQQLSDTLIEAPELFEAYELFGCKAPMSFKAVGAEHFTERAPSSKPFWQALGFERTAIDLVGDAIRIDLNYGRVPWRLRGIFDFVVNAGTTEHVANQLNAFAVIHDLCRIGGVMYHELPAGGHINHGLISYEPKFFHRICEANGYESLFLHYWTHGKCPSGNILNPLNRL